MSSDVWTASEQGNLALIQAVKRHPCLYNNTLPEYSQKDVTNAAWQEIAQQFGCSALACKKKWHNFRTSLSRELRTKNKKKPYFYTKPLRFLLPYLQQDSQVNKLKGENEETILGLPYVSDNNDLTCSKPQEEPNIQFNKVNSLHNLHTDGNLPTNGNYCLLQIPQLFVIQSVATEKIAELKSGKDSQHSFNYTGSSLSEANDLNNLKVEPTNIQCVKTSDNEKPSHGKANKASDASHKANDKEDTSHDTSDLWNLRRQFILSLMPEVNLMTETQFFSFKRKLFRLIDSLSEK